MTQTPVPTGKLDAATSVVVSGPEDATTNLNVGGSVGQPAAVDPLDAVHGLGRDGVLGVCLSRMR